ncbi:c-type cytochrome [Candidatus Viridilinea mediisalina]|uniref:Quinol:cytochrome C oxidoreductase n=1 Tax=Candidatus Viridilinea mediisalina TaxID=2024553 RepID=A0A2A6RMB0_9CHLR|nr:cytochrome c [Candidatus Viridilinea mediisalina]PDW04018.1 quinol:cytochrome C oxidoreductase [Candidatus Viridilinea mediisalina]
MQSLNRFRRFFRYSWLALLVLLLSGCHFDMYNQPSIRTYEPSSFFEDGRGSRPNVEGAVAVNAAFYDEYFLTGLVDGVPGDELPLELTRELLERGQAQYNIWCAVCHGHAGYGVSVIAQRGGIVPANFHQQRLRDASLGHFFNIMTVGVYRGDPEQDGFRSMYSYASRISAEDRWAIAAYIRALQLSQNATIDDVPQDRRGNLGNN